MELKEAIQAGRELAEYIVYCCGEGEDYVALVDQLRQANTRSALIKAVYLLLCYGDVCLKQKMKGMSQKRLDDLFQFFRTGDIASLSHFRSALIANISTFELEKIHYQEKYLMELLRV
ncbi:hypothetical protein MK805_06895 [Shimazuella sp. AN120528]|uniref:hypothetical protein n=1 Tax=Shimazuella soli TaxID=1892854 RepID=UPI001F10F3A4|nr:hypothetical protein [Shimazuella soli]MCH5584697.1 hypothetical protein [Shimazuella soli]